MKLDKHFILESLHYTKRKFLSYEYPNDEIRKERIKKVNDVIKQVRNI